MQIEILDKFDKDKGYFFDMDRHVFITKCHPENWMYIADGCPVDVVSERIGFCKKYRVCPCSCIESGSLKGISDTEVLLSNTEKGKTRFVSVIDYSLKYILDADEDYNFSDNPDKKEDGEDSLYKDKIYLKKAKEIFQRNICQIKKDLSELSQTRIKENRGKTQNKYEDSDRVTDKEGTV